MKNTVREHGVKVENSNLIIADLGNECTHIFPYLSQKVYLYTFGYQPKNGVAP